MNFISLFFQHLFANLASFGGAISTLHSTTSVSGTYTTSLGTDTVSNADDVISSTVGTSVVTIGTAIINSGDAAFDDYQRQVHSVQMSDAYIESLPEEEIDELIASLSDEEPKQPEEPKTLTKHL